MRRRRPRATSTPRPPSRCTRPLGRRSGRGLGPRLGRSGPPVLLGASGRSPARAARASRSRSSCAAAPDEVAFTGSGTQAVHLAVAGVVPGGRRRGARVVASAVEHSAVLQALRLVESRGGSYALAPVDRLGRVDAGAYRGAADRRHACWRACSTPTTRSARCSRSTRSRDACAAARRPAARRRRRSRSAASRRRTGGRCWPPARTSGAGRPGVGVLAIRRSARWRSPSPADDRGPVPGYPAVPLVVAAAAALEAVAADAERENQRLRALVDRIRADGPGRGAGRRGGRRPDRAAPPPRDVLLPLRRRRGAADRAGPARVRRVVRVVVHVERARALARARRDGGAVPRQHPGVAAARSRGGRRRRGSWPSCPDVVGSVRAQLGARGL